MSESLLSPYAAALGLVMIVLSFRISFARMRAGVSLGCGTDRVLTERVRAFGNFAEWTPVALILLVLAERAGAPAGAIHAGAALLLAGRIVHPLGLSADRLVTPLRFLGMLGTYLAILVSAFHLLRTTTGL